MASNTDHAATEPTGLDFSAYALRPAPVTGEPHPLARIAPKSALHYGIVHRIRKRSQGLHAIDPDGAWSVPELTGIYGDDDTVFWAWALGCLEQAELHGQPINKYRLTRWERLLRENHRPVVTDGYWGELWFYHWLLATARQAPVVWWTVNTVVAEGRRDDRLERVTRELSGGRDNDWLRSDEARTIITAQMACCEASYAAGGCFAPLEIGPRERPPKNLSQKLFAATVAMHAFGLLRGHDQQMLALPIAALWEPGSPAHLFRLDLLSAWDAIIGQQSGIDSRTHTQGKGYFLKAFVDAVMEHAICDGHILVSGLVDLSLPIIMPLQDRMLTIAAFHEDDLWGFFAEDIDFDDPGVNRSLYIAGRYDDEGGYGSGTP